MVRELVEGPDGRWKDARQTHIDVRHALKEAHYIATLWRDSSTNADEQKRAERTMAVIEVLISQL